MAKVAIPAFSKGFGFVLKNWKGVGILALKTILLIVLFQLLASLPSQIIMGPQAVLQMHSNPSSIPDIPASLLFLNLLTTVIGFFLAQWISSPLLISISRSVVLSEPFDRILLKRLTQKRTVRVAKLLWSMILVMIPLYSLGYAMFLVAVPLSKGIFIINPGWVILLFLAVCAYIIFYFYIIMRINYLVPPLACDQQFSSISETWRFSRGHAWSVFKVLLLGILLIIALSILFMAALFLISILMNFVAHLEIVGKLALQLLLGLILFFLLVLMVAIFILFIPQVVWAGIANVYKMSLSRT